MSVYQYIITQVACEAQHYIRSADRRTLLRAWKHIRTHAVCSAKTKVREIEMALRKLDRQRKRSKQ